jgi:serine/threonine-protein kinase HipA
VTNSDLESLAERIDGDPLQGQRRAFNPADYATARAPRRRSPFAK